MKAPSGEKEARAVRSTGRESVPAPTQRGQRMRDLEDAMRRSRCTCERLDVDLYDSRGCTSCDPRLQEPLPAEPVVPLPDGDVEF